MIVFQTQSAQLNLTHLKPSLIEESNWFVNDSLKNYSLPFNIDFESTVAQKLGLANIKNIATYNAVITGTLIIDDDFYNAYIKIDEVQGDYAEATLHYGADILPVYSTQLKDLPWPTIVCPTTLAAYAKTLLDMEYPELTHNFPSIYRPSIKELDDYSEFLYFVNYYNGGAFTENETIIGSPSTFKNYNVMAPFPYMLEILRFGYLQEGLEVRGELFETDLLKKIVFIPDNYFERFITDQYDAFQFDFPTSFQLIDGIEMGVYERVYTPSLVGTYDIKFDVNLASGVATYFSLIITAKDAATQVETTIYSAISNNSNVYISEEIEINVAVEDLFDQIKIQLIIPRQNYSIAPYNTFEYNYSEGRENVFPTQYTLSEFVPKMSFGDYQNEIKNWLNLDINKVDNIIYIDFVEDKLQTLERITKEHLQDPKKKHKLNTDRYFTLKYAEDQEVRVDATGQVFTTPTEHQEEIPLEMNISPAKVRENHGFLTGVFNEDASGLRFGIYDGFQTPQARNYMVDRVGDENISLQQIYDRRWKLWLNFRTHSKTYKEKFMAHVSELFPLKKAMLKYNELHIIKKITKKRKSTKYWEIESESETL